jgi:hypothetical protein
LSKVVPELKSGFTARAVTIGVILLLFWSIFIVLVFPFNLNAAFLWQQFGPQFEWPIQRNYLSVFLFWAFIPFLILSFSRRLTRQELLVIYTMITVGAFAPGIQTSFLPALFVVGGGYLFNPAYKDILPKVIPSTWAPIEESFYKASGFYDGGAAVPWGTWAPYIAYWVIFAAVVYIFFAVIGSMTRKIFVDVEDLPFPSEVTAAEFLIDSTATKESTPAVWPSLWQNKLFWASFLIGFFGMAGLWLHYVYPPFTTVTRTFVDLTPLAIIPWSALVFSIEPWAIGLALLLPVDVLASSIIWGIILVIIVPVIAVAAGWWPPFPTGNYANTLAWQGFTMPGASPAGALPWGINPVLWGALIMLGVWPLIRHRSYIAESLRKASSGIADGEALSHRTMWILAIILPIIIVAMMAYQLVPVWLAIVLVIFAVLNELGNTVARGTVWPLAHKFEMMYWTGNLVAFLGISANVPPMGLVGAIIFQWLLVYHMAISIPTPQTVAMLKVGKITATIPKDVFKSVVIAAIVPFIVNIFINLPLIHSMGAAKAYAFAHWTDYGGGLYAFLGITGGYEHTYFIQSGPPGIVLGINILVGAILVLLLFLLRARFPKTSWFTVPGAIVTSWYIWTTGLMLPWIIGLIAKYFIIRIGGEKLYREKGIPIAMGFILGMGLTTLVSAIGFRLGQPSFFVGIAPGG